jgi:outer membrane protein assembly factor BamB
LLWAVASEGRVFTECAALDGGNLIFGDGEGFAYGVGVEDGELTWKFDAKDHVAADDWVGERKVSVHGAPFVVEGRVVMRAGSGRDLICLDSESGELLWHYQAPAPVKNIACGGDFLYHTSHTGQIFAVSTRTGVLAWSQRNDGHDLGDTAAHGGLVVGGLYLCGFNSSHRLAAFSTEDGTVCWTFKKKGKGGFAATPIFVERKLLVGADFGELYCFDSTDD